MTDSTQSSPPLKKAWLDAARPRTLPLALSCIILGTFLAVADGAYSWPITTLCLVTAVFLQILSNLANDYGDSIHGADHVQREGPQRAVQSGQISAATMRRAMFLFAGLSAVSGLALIWLAFGAEGLIGLLIFVLLGGTAIWAAVNYTAGSKPYGYAGWGDLFVLIFFGWVGVLGPYFLMAQRLDWALLLPATSCGLLAVAVLNVNNIRDIESDKLAGKFSIPVRLGPARARMYHWGLLGTAVFLTTLYVLLTFSSYWAFLYILAVPLLVRNGTAVQNTTSPTALNPLLKQMVLSALAFNLLLGLGLTL
ncbi:1,4-dihydroxy-2-naphthoate polyprenyltransferase [Candidatus Leptofilum sp.]|uniref:1,4-dihydroxy-2-naphthoate polyprenyltransferase n=1 Tax=Candidatus Leptofilum sp. TaxID=3241576 RepID=UPI003B5CB60F